MIRAPHLMERRCFQSWFAIPIDWVAQFAASVRAADARIPSLLLAGPAPYVTAIMSTNSLRERSPTDILTCHPFRARLGMLDLALVSRACKVLLLAGIVAYLLLRGVIPAFTAITDDFPEPCSSCLSRASNR
jgi:hypothetical protein